jgi:DnaJ-domain-containing protein 1
MSETEIEQECRADATWQRPSWPLGTVGAVLSGAASGFQQKRSHQTPSGQSFQDPFDLFNDGSSCSHFFSQSRFSSQSAEGKALCLFGLSFPFSQNELRKGYRDLVKKHHPDANGGSLEAEETIKRINEAYEVLKRVSYDQKPRQT